MDQQSQQGMQRFLTLLSHAQDTDAMMAILACFLTPEELEAISLRVNVVKALLDGQMSQREISRTLKASISKISRGSRQLKQISPELSEQLKQIL